MSKIKDFLGLSAFNFIFHMKKDRDELKKVMLHGYLCFYWNKERHIVNIRNCLSEF